MLFPYIVVNNFYFSSVRVNKLIFNELQENKSKVVIIEKHI